MWRPAQRPRRRMHTRTHARAQARTHERTHARIRVCGTHMHARARTGAHMYVGTTWWRTCGRQEPLHQRHGSRCCRGSPLAAPQWLIDWRIRFVYCCSCGLTDSCMQGRYSFCTALVSPTSALIAGGSACVAWEHDIFNDMCQRHVPATCAATYCKLHVANDRTQQRVRLRPILLWRPQQC